MPDRTLVKALPVLKDAGQVEAKVRSDMAELEAHLADNLKDVDRVDGLVLALEVHTGSVEGHTAATEILDLEHFETVVVVVVVVVGSFLEDPSDPCWLEPGPEHIDC